MSEGQSMKRNIRSTEKKMSSEYTAPQVREHARDMLMSMGELLAGGASVKAKISAIALATRLNAGRLKRYLYQEVERVPADEYLTIQAWHQRLKARLGEFEQRYNEARREVLEGDPALGAVCPPEIAAAPDRPARPAVDPETNARLLRAFEVQKRRIAPWGGR